MSEAGEITEATYLQEALTNMKSRPPNKDGTIGVTITPKDSEWNPWQAYFLGKRMNGRAGNMRARNFSGYMVPCKRPEDFDPFGIAKARQEYAARIHNGEIPKPDTSRKAHEIPYEERCRMAEELQAIGRAIDKKNREAFAKRKFRQHTPADYMPRPLDSKGLTPQEEESARRLMGSTLQIKPEAAE